MVQAGEAVPEGAQIVSMPLQPMYASSVYVAEVGNDYMVTFASHHLGQATVNGMAEPVASTQPVATIALSPLTLKDLVLVLGDALQRYETQYGEVRTAFTTMRSAK